MNDREQLLREEIRPMLLELVGTPLEKIMLYQPTASDPFGIKQLSDTSRTQAGASIHELSYESVETIKRQMQRLAQVEDQLIPLITKHTEQIEIKAEIEGKHKALDKLTLGAGEYHDDPYEYVVPLRHIREYRQELNKLDLNEPIFREAQKQQLSKDYTVAPDNSIKNGKNYTEQQLKLEEGQDGTRTLRPRV